MASEAVQSNLDNFLPICSDKTETTPEQRSLFTHPLKKGWLVPYLVLIDQMTTKRWDYWIRTLATGKILEEPIPKIEINPSPDEKTLKMLRDCLDYAKNKGISDSLILLVQWLLWGLNSNLVNEFSSYITEDISNYWYKKFNLGLLLQHPADYFMYFASIQKNGYCSEVGRFGYFGTPPNVAMMMVEITLAGECSEKSKNQHVHDPCCDTGNFLLCASNHSLILSGADINPHMAIFATCNAYFYVPWLVGRIECKDALLS